MPNSIIVLSSDDEGDSPTDPWASYASKAVKYTVIKTVPPPPQSPFNNDPFHIGYPYVTPLKVTPHKGDQLHHDKYLICDNSSVVEGLKATSPTVWTYREGTTDIDEEGERATSSSNLGEGFTTTSSIVQK